MNTSCLSGQTMPRVEVKFCNDSTSNYVIKMLLTRVYVKKKDFN